MKKELMDKRFCDMTQEELILCCKHLLQQKFLLNSTITLLEKENKLLKGQLK